MSLAKLQRAFQAHLVSGDDSVSALVNPVMRRGLPVYAYAYRATLRAALRDTFEKTLLWLGEEAFDAAAEQYIDQNPSHSWTLSDYGDRFAEYLGKFTAEEREIGELAWLDWALRSAFAAGNLPPLDPDALATIDWDCARFVLSPHLSFRLVETNVIEVWNGLPDAAVAALPLDQPYGLVVWRSELTPKFRSATPVEIDALHSLAAGDAFGTMCAAIAERHGSDAETIGAMLAVWLSDRLVTLAH